jgi:hypothetical protein
MNPVKKAIFTLTLLGAPVPAFSASMIIDSIVERSAIETGAILRAQANVRSRLSYPGSASFSGVRRRSRQAVWALTTRHWQSVGGY